MFGKSYSSSALTLATNAVRVIDEKLTFDLQQHKPSEIPPDSEWQISGFFSIFNKKREVAASKRVAFNNGLISGIAKYFYDGEGKHFDEFVRLAIKGGLREYKILLKQKAKVERNFPNEFSIGFQYSNGFIKRHFDFDGEKKN